MNIKTRRTGWLLFFFILAAATSHIAADNSLPVVRSRTMNIDYQVNIEPAHLSRIELWYSRGTGEGAVEPWQLYNYDMDKVSPAGFVAAGEGVFRFLIVAVDQRGQASCRTDGNGMGMVKIPAEVRAQQTVFVDYTPPQLFLRSPRSKAEQEHNQALKISWVGFDTHLSGYPVQLFYGRQVDGNEIFTPIATPLPATGEYLWRIPEQISGPVTIKAVLTDITGNIDTKSSGWINIIKSGSTAQPLNRNTNLKSNTNKKPEPDKKASKEPDKKASKEPDKKVSKGVSGNSSKVISETDAKAAKIRTELRRKAESYYIRGSLYRQRHEWSKAAQAYDKALAIDEQYLEARLRLGDVFYNMNQFDQARRQFELCLKLRDDSQAALFGLAQSQMALKQFRQAGTSLEKLLKADNRDAQAWLMHGDAAQQLGQKEIAVSSWQQAGRIGSPMISRTAQERIDNFYP
ncbi:MAG: tetratricopeptide repeat protein [Sedimentisphaerales bacterium]|nr:tetratricopeptide repeat protein [Sedimentisphaerales bacterium]